MGFIKRHAFLLVCALAGIGGVVLGVLYYQKMPEVQNEMRKVAGLYRDLQNLRNQDANQDAIDAQKKRIASIEEDHDRILAHVKQLYDYEPLLPGLFPSPDEKDAYEKRIKFREVYTQAMRDLLKRLGEPNPAGFRLTREMEELVESERIANEMDGRQDVLDKMENDLYTRTEAGVVTSWWVKGDPQARADLYAAQKISCYYVTFERARQPFPTASLDFYSPMIDTGTGEPPIMVNCWLAQLNYWVQKDVVEAIASINQSAAAELPKENQWVAYMPIKDVISVRVKPDYVTELEGEILGSSPGGYTEALPMGTGESVFTQSVCNRTYDVVQFTVKLVMEQEAVPAFLERLCANGFVTPLRIAYTSVPTNYGMRRRIYGNAPVVNVVMDFELLMVADIFQRVMPPEVCDFYTFMCPKD